jgi:hypothetical protein
VQEYTLSSPTLLQQLLTDSHIAEGHHGLVTLRLQFQDALVPRSQLCAKLVHLMLLLLRLLRGVVQNTWVRFRLPSPA